MNLRCSCSPALGELFAPLRAGLGAAVAHGMSVHAGGGLPPSRVAWGASWRGVNLASPTGSGVDLRAVAGARQKGEVLCLRRHRYNGRLCEGHSCRCFCCVRQRRAFRHAIWMLCAQGPVCAHHCIAHLQLLSYIAPHVTHALFVGMPLSDGCKLASPCMPCLEPWLASAFRCLVLSSGFGPSVMSRSRWGAFLPRRLGSQAAADGPGLSVPLGR